MGDVSAASPVEVEPTQTPDEITLVARPWVTIVWNDPVNLMSYVTYVFQTYFGYDRAKAEKLMLEVHTRGSLL
jgi:ATP-dependent Clp protease adaptor protein ClpS